MTRAVRLCATLLFALFLGAGSAAADCPTGCDDGNPCTDDICDATLGCVHANNTLPCTDGNACTTADACNGGVCVGGDRAAGCTSCQAVATLPAAGAVVRGSISGTSSLSGTCGTSNLSPERVFKWTPTTSGVASFRTCSTNTTFDSVVYVRQTSCASGAQQACNDDGPCATSVSASEGSIANLNVTAGTDYFIVVDGWNGSQGNFELSVSAPTLCGNDVREGVEQCDGTDHAACATGACTATCSCVPPQTGVPDLQATVTDWFFDFDTTVSQGDVSEGCAEAQTGIDLLRLGVNTRNIGTGDFYIGPPGCPSPCTEHPLEVCGNPKFVCSPAQGHNHAHYTDFARYELLDASNQSVVVGHKQGFCLKDGYDAGPCPTHFYDCDNQGISDGCADYYESSLGCQYLDITGVPPGSYTLRAWVDPFDRVQEISETNNIVTIPVSIPPHGCSNPTTIPPAGGSFTGTTSGASTLVGGCGGATSTAPEAVFRWTPTASGQATIDTCDASATAFDTVLYVRETDCRTGAQLACNNNTAGCETTVGGGKGSRVTLNVTAGQTYFLVVDGGNGEAGNFKLNVAGPAPAAACSNGADDDGDGAFDYPADTGCTSAQDPSERPECSDGLDNDADALIDFGSDIGCTSAVDPSEQTECADGIDNDGDGLTDFPADPGCKDALPLATEKTQCNDGLDNDGDGPIDFPADSNCTSASYTVEGSSACGLLGFEALLPAAIALTIRRRRGARAGSDLRRKP